MPRGRPKKVEPNHPVIFPSEVEALATIRKNVFFVYRTMIDGDVITYRDVAKMHESVMLFMEKLDGGKFK